MNKEKKYLPIGTVVILKNGVKRLMIIGFCSKAQETPDVIYDYIGCIYPEGLLSSGDVSLFNHDQIEKIFHKGLVDKEEISFKNRLNDIVSKYS